MQDYSKRKLTYGKDKLIALSGLAHDYYEREEKSPVFYEYYKGEKRGKYGAGLWEDVMPSALLWRTYQPFNASPFQLPLRPLEYRAPSWSWASVDAQVSYNSQMLESEHVQGGIWLQDDPPSPREPSEYNFGAFCIQEIETITSSPDSMGAVSTGHITLIGLVAIAIIGEETPISSFRGGTSIHTWIIDQDCSVVGALLADFQTEVRRYDEIYCTSIRDEQDGAEVQMPEELGKLSYGHSRDRGERSEMIMGLGLAKIGEEENMNVFKRLGLVRWVRKELFHGKVISTVKVV